MEQKARKTITRLSPAQVDELLSRKELRILDARDEASFDKDHFASATRLHGTNLDAVILGTPKQHPLLIYCYRGSASDQYANMFADFGFSEIYDLVGGYEAWRSWRAMAQGTPAVSPTLASWMNEQGYAGGDINATIANRSTPLMQAVRLGDVAIAKELVACGAALAPTNLDGKPASPAMCSSWTY